MRKAFSAISIAVAACLNLPQAAGTASAADSAHVLLADMSIHFLCRPRPSDEFEPLLENFLRRNGYTVLNQGRIRRDHGVYLQSVLIMGIFEDKSIIEFMSLDYQAGRYTVRLNTRPPTNHIKSLETAIEKFAGGELHCDIRQESHGDNPIEAVELFDSSVAKVRSLMRQAEEPSDHPRI